MKLLKLYKVLTKSRTQETFGSTTIPAEGIIVYGNYAICNTIRGDLYMPACNGLLEGLSVDTNTIIPSVYTMDDIIYIADTGAIIDLTDCMQQVHWNMGFANQLISVIRGDALTIGLSNCGTNASQLLTKMQTCLTLLQVGMLAEASLTMKYSVVTDGFLTRERLDNYAAMCDSADAIGNY